MPSGALIGNYIRIVLRKMRRQKGYSFITIAGLGVGLACCILMILWVADELSFDRFHAKRASIYRLIAETKNEAGTMRDAHPVTPLGPAVKADLPEVEDFCRYRTGRFYGVKRGEKAFLDEIVGVADPSFFTFFSFPLLEGDPKTALEGPYSIVLTKDLAGRLDRRARHHHRPARVDVRPARTTSRYLQATHRRTRFITRRNPAPAR